MRKKVFISGKVSGLEYVEACRLFYDCARKVLRLGFTPVIPVEICKSHWSWRRCMAVCLWHLLWSDGFCQLENWENSRGARIEYKFAKFLRKKFIVV